MDIFLGKFLPFLPMAQKRFQGTGHRVFYSATTLKMCFPAAPPNKTEKVWPEVAPNLAPFIMAENFHYLCARFNNIDEKWQAKRRKE